MKAHKRIYRVEIKLEFEFEAGAEVDDRKASDHLEGRKGGREEKGGRRNGSHRYDEI